jgi:hypothetical protein
MNSYRGQSTNLGRIRSSTKICQDWLTDPYHRLLHHSGISAAYSTRSCHGIRLDEANLGGHVLHQPSRDALAGRKSVSPKSRTDNPRLNSMHKGLMDRHKQCVVRGWHRMCLRSHEETVQ